MKTYDNHGSLNWRHATDISSTQPLSWLGVWLSFLLGAVLQILCLCFSNVKGTENHLQVLALCSSLTAVCGDSLGTCTYNQLAGNTKILFGQIFIWVAGLYRITPLIQCCYKKLTKSLKPTVMRRNRSKNAVLYVIFQHTVIEGHYANPRLYPSETSVLPNSLSYTVEDTAPVTI